MLSLRDSCMDVVLDKATLDTMYNMDSEGNELSVFRVRLLEVHNASTLSLTVVLYVMCRCYQKQAGCYDQGVAMWCCRTHHQGAEKKRFATSAIAGHWYDRPTHCTPDAISLSTSQISVTEIQKNRATFYLYVLQKSQ
jgi:hypothetical protein